MAKGVNEQNSRTSAEIERELRDIERRLRVHPANDSSDILALLASIFVIVASTAGLPLGILGVVAIARQFAHRRKLLRKAEMLDRRLTAERHN